MELNDVVLNQLDIDAVLAFAEHVVTNSSRLWTELDLAQKQRLQQVLFPEGLRFEGERFGATVTCLAFKEDGGNRRIKVIRNGVPRHSELEPDYGVAALTYYVDCAAS